MYLPQPGYTLLVDDQPFRIRGDTITLGQLLKACGIASSGSEAKEILAVATITVNGRPENRRGAKLHPGDRVIVDGGRPIVLQGDT